MRNLSQSPLLTEDQKAKFDQQIELFRAGVEKIHAAYWKEGNYTHNPGSLAKVVKGNRYARVLLCEMRWVDDRTKTDVIKNNDGTPFTSERGQIHSFIDMMTGDVLKPASWKAPAKHPRGNIFDEWNGLKYVNHFGPQYLK